MRHRKQKHQHQHHRNDRNSSNIQTTRVVFCTHAKIRTASSTSSLKQLSLPALGEVAGGYGNLTHNTLTVIAQVSTYIVLF